MLDLPYAVRVRFNFGRRLRTHVGSIHFGMAASVISVIIMLTTKLLLPESVSVGISL